MTQPKYWVAVRVGGHRNYEGPFTTWWRARMFYDMGNAIEYHNSLLGRIDRVRIKVSWQSESS